MLAEQAIFQLIRDDVDVQAFDPHIYAGRLPQSVVVDGETVQPYPGVAYRVTGRRPVRVLEGGCTLLEETIQIFTAATDTNASAGYTIASDLDHAIFRALDEFSGTVADETVSPPDSIDIQGIFATEKAHVYVGEDDAVRSARVGVHHFMSEYVVHYSVAAPNKNAES